jgi:hypothetical protein
LHGYEGSAVSASLAYSRNKITPRNSHLIDSSFRWPRVNGNADS